MAFVRGTISARAHRVGENEEFRGHPALFIQALVKKIILVIEHVLKALTCDVALTRPINRVAELHVVGRHGFCDGAGGAAHLKKTARHLLSGANFCKGPVVLPIEIYLERFFVRSDIHFRIHEYKKFKRPSCPDCLK